MGTGRPKALTPEQVDEVCRLFLESGLTKAAISRRVGCSWQTVVRALEGRQIDHKGWRPVPKRIEQEENFQLENSFDKRW